MAYEGPVNWPFLSIMKQEELQNFLSHGAADPLPARTPLRAGSLSICFEGGDLRYIKFGEREVIRRIYAAVRDRNWGTIPGVISKLEQRIGLEDFEIRYQCEHRQNEIHFVWDATIAGNADGTLHLTFDGEAKTTFLRNRIGFCVLHPIRECAGAKCRAIYADGACKESVFPSVIAAEQPVAPLHDLAGLEHEVVPGVWAELRFEGDLFETEDQRNWIDASFKTFCTPLRLPYPVEIKAGTRIQQTIRLRLIAPEQTKASTKLTRPINAGLTRPIRITTHATSISPAVSSPRPLQKARPLPAIGLGWATHRQDLAPTEVERLTALNLAHLRLDVLASDASSSTQLTIAIADSEHLGTRIELAIYLDGFSDWGSAEAYLDALGSQLRAAACAPIRILVFDAPQENSTSAAALASARLALGGLGVPIGAGTNSDLYQLNLRRPPADADFICWSMNPQVHAFDCTSMAETPEAAAQQVTSVRAYYPGKSPITFKPRFNPVATGPETATARGELPPEVDSRQLSLFGAAWTLAMIKALAEAGADSVTFYETTGWRGVMETETGSTHSEKFPSIPGTVFPLYHVLADVGEFAGGEVVLTESSDSLTVASLLLRKGDRSRLLLANLTGHGQKVLLENFRRACRVRTMDLSNIHAARTKPKDFRDSTREFEGTGIDLEAHAVAAIDLSND
jgi:hypothetical protein